MVWHHTKLLDIDVMPFGNVLQNFSAKVFMFLSPKHVVPVLGTPLKVVQVLANTMATAHKFQNFVLLSRPSRHLHNAGVPAQKKKSVVWGKKIVIHPHTKTMGISHLELLRNNVKQDDIFKFYTTLFIISL